MTAGRPEPADGPAAAYGRTRPGANGHARSTPPEGRHESVVDRAGDLEYTTERLRQRGHELLAEYERNAKALARVGVGGEQVTGRGTAEDEAVVIEVDSDNRLLDLTLDPRALRLGSIANLRTAIMDAFTAAADDVAAQLADTTTGLEGDPVREMLESMPELMAIMPEEMYQEYLEPGDDDDVTDAPPASATGEVPL
ncbi:YbaB/EbfC family nucleoid-associated protein [Propionibacteriaceae bacterium Y1685]|uniref:YbaB/EbfC family nucleoid-associated protein n=1 Tax=Microlunatus sp. Y1700 TaxID=3418487 RepID=UPI003B793BEF